MSRTALVTGGAGFIGAHLSAQLQRQGWHVIILDDLSEGSRANLRFLNVDADLVVADVAEKTAWDALTGCAVDTIFHLAGQANVPKSVQDPLFDFHTNVLGTLNALEFARREQVRKVLFASTVSVYAPDVAMPITEDRPTRASSPYGASKAAGENYCTAYAKSYDLDITVFRLFNVFGPLMTKYVIHDLVRKLQADPHRLVILGDGSQVRDYLYVDDAARAFLLAAERGQPGAVCNLGSGIPVRISDLAQHVIAEMGLDGVEVEYTMASWPGDINAWYADITRLRELGFCPTVFWQEGLGRTVRFLLDYPQGLEKL